jgi:hypothetical protein
MADAFAMSEHQRACLLGKLLGGDGGELRAESEPGQPVTGAPDPIDAEIKIIRRDRLGGLLHEYAQVA